MNTPICDFVRDYVTAKQNPETGLWGDGIDYDATDAGLKASPLYDKDHPYPHFEEMVHSVLKTLEENKDRRYGVNFESCLFELIKALE